MGNKLNLEKKPREDFRKKYEKRVKRFRRYAQLDESSLSKEMAELPSQIFHVGQVKADAGDRLDKAKMQLKVTKAKVDKEIRQRYTGKQKPSEKQIENRIIRHKDVCSCALDYSDAKWLFNICWAAMNSLNKKSEQLIAMANDRRKEMEYGVKNTKLKSRDKRIKDKLSR